MPDNLYFARVVTSVKETFFWFVYTDGVVDTGCATKNDVTTGINANLLHVSCSDSFPSGVPQKSDLGTAADGSTRLVRTYYIVKSGGKKTCGMLPPTPPSPPKIKIKKSASSDWVYYGGLVTFKVSVWNSGGGTASNVVVSDRLPNGMEFVRASSGCSYSSSTRTVTCDAGDLPATSSAPTSNPCDGKLTYYRWQYNDGGTDEGCAKKNDVTRSENPNLIADELHVSCSDTIRNGVPRKSDLGSSSRRVTAYLIIKKGGKKTCGQGSFIPPKKSFEIVVKVKKDGCNVAMAKSGSGEKVYSDCVCVYVKPKPPCSCSDKTTTYRYRPH